MKHLRAFAAYLERASAREVVFAIIRWSLILGVMVVGVRLVASLVLYPVFKAPLDPVIELAVLGGFGVAGGLLSLLIVGVLGLANRRAPELERLPAPAPADGSAGHADGGNAAGNSPNGETAPHQNPAIMFGLSPDAPK